MSNGNVSAQSRRFKRGLSLYTLVIFYFHLLKILCFDHRNSLIYTDFFCTRHPLKKLKKQRSCTYKLIREMIVSSFVHSHVVLSTEAKYKSLANAIAEIM